MASDRRSWRSSGSKECTSPTPTPPPPPASSSTMPASPVAEEHTDGSETRKPRVLTKALRSFSTPVLDTTATHPTRSSNSLRRMNKTSSSGSGSMMERLHRRLSKDSTISASPSDNCPASPLECPYSSLEVLKHDVLRTELSNRKARSEYLVLTDRSLAKFPTFEAAQAVFPQLTPPTPTLQRSSSSASMQSKHGLTSPPQLEIPHSSVIAVFSDGLPGSRSDLDVWWSAPEPRLSSCRTSFCFNSPAIMEAWLAEIQRACRAKMRTNPTNAVIFETLRTRINSIVHSTEPVPSESAKIPIFPVVKRVSGNVAKAPLTNDGRVIVDLSSCYLAIGPYMCYVIEVLKTETSRPAAELSTKVASFGTVTLTRFRASVATHTQAFMMAFRPPFDRDVRFDFASVHYRRIIDTLIKVDRALKPTWPQHLQQTIFEIRGLPPPLQLTLGNDLGGLETSLPAYCVAFGVSMPNWTIDWNTPTHPCFRLLPSPDEEDYEPLQLLAVFRALRYNSYFKAVSFEGVNLTPLMGHYDHMRQGDSIAHTSSSRLRLSDDYYDALLHASVLEQEIHSLLFASDSTRSINFNNVLGQRSGSPNQTFWNVDSTSQQKMSAELIRPLIKLGKKELAHFHSIELAGNILAPGDVDDLVHLLVLDHVHMRVLNIAGCGLGDAGLSKLWFGLAGQAGSLQVINTSDNHGVARFETIQSTLSQLHGLKKLSIAKNTRLTSDLPLFTRETIETWPLQELDLSGIMLNDATIDVLAYYLATEHSIHLRTLTLNNCGLTGWQLAHLFNNMGVCREVQLHIEGARLDDGIEHLCESIANGYGPWSLFAPMVDFCREESYIQLLQALTANETIRCLSLAGSSIPDDASEMACQALYEFFSGNIGIRYLDISGYDSKLDEGRLGRGFSKALRGIKDNTSIEHLRVRSQLLNINVGDLAEAIAGNKTLRTLDCESNDFNLSNYRHLIKRLEYNESICYLSAFSKDEFQESVNKVIETATPVVPNRRSSMMARFKQDKKPANNEQVLVADLKNEWEAVAQQLSVRLHHNQQYCPSNADIFGEYTEDDWSLVFATSFGGLTLDELGDRRRNMNPLLVQNADAIASDDQESHTAPSSFVQRSDSTNSNETNGSSSIGDASNESGIPTPSDVHTSSETKLNLHTSDSNLAIYGEQQDAASYTYADGYDVESGGLQMKRYQRFCDNPINRIDEEDVGI